MSYVYIEEHIASIKNTIADQTFEEHEKYDDLNRMLLNELDKQLLLTKKY